MSIADSTAAATSTWSIDPAHTTVEFSVKHLMISTVRGHFGAVTGTIVLDEQNPAASTVTAEIDVTSINTRQEQRDAHLRSADFFDVEQFPAIKFQSTRIERDGDHFDVVGNLTIRDVTREVVLHTSDEGRGGDPWGGQRAAFSATTKIDRREFGLTWNQALETGGVVVGNDIKISLEVQAVKA
jgi:polyisoprenoid-binding protein YceI